MKSEGRSFGQRISHVHSKRLVVLRLRLSSLSPVISRFGSKTTVSSTVDEDLACNFVAFLSDLVVSIGDLNLGEFLDAAVAIGFLYQDGSVVVSADAGEPRV